MSSIIFLLLLISGMASAQNKVNTQTLKFGRLLHLIDSYYVDTTDINKNTEDAIRGMLGKLDPHSVYISKEEVEEMNAPLQGSFDGIGISFNILQDTLFVVSTIPGGPSEKVGIQPSDRIIFVDGKMIAGIGIKNNDVFKMLRGKKGTKVELKVLRKNKPSLLDFTIVRDKIPMYSLDASYMLDKKTGYIKINRFSSTTIPEFDKAMTELKAQNMENLVLDLRGNGGGLLKAAFELADHFIGSYKMLVYTEGTKSPRREYKATAKGDFEKGQLVILINEGSASASEIVAGAVQDWDRGILVGRRSFGKGLVQQPFLLTDGSMVRLTTAHYYTPAGRCIQRSYNKGTNAYHMDRFLRYQTGEMFNKDSVHFADSLKYKTKVYGRTVYGGGGIMPDVFTPLDSTKNYKYLNMIVRKNVLFPYILKYVEKNRAQLESQYPTFKKYLKSFTVTDAMLEELYKNAKEEGVEKDQESLDSTLDELKIRIKAFIARDIFDQEKFYEVINTNDEELRKALEIIEDSKSYNKILSSVDK
ncbi:S41 family peptidase [Prolixibacteraceae bacterium JC049]|nr:S41 family peptidase [Prolixibacteraceae bacterium JC049]